MRGLWPRLLVAIVLTTIGGAERSVSAEQPHLVFISDLVFNRIGIFTASGRPFANVSLSPQPNRLFTTESGDLYASIKGSIKVFSPPYKKARATIYNGQEVSGIAVESNSGPQPGLVAVVGVLPEAVFFYRPGKQQPCAELQSPEILADAFDANGNLYVIIYPQHGPFYVGVISGGCSAKQITPLTTTNSIQPTGVRVTADGHIAVFEEGSTADIYTYNPPVNGTLGSPISRTLFVDTSLATTFVFTADDKHVWVVDGYHQAAIEYPYPVTGRYERVIPYGQFGSVLGSVAITPVATP